MKLVTLANIARSLRPETVQRLLVMRATESGQATLLKVQTLPRPERPPMASASGSIIIETPATQPAARQAPVESPVAPLVRAYAEAAQPMPPSAPAERAVAADDARAGFIDIRGGEARTQPQALPQYGLADPHLAASGRSIAIAPADVARAAGVTGVAGRPGSRLADAKPPRGAAVPAAFAVAFGIALVLVVLVFAIG